MTKYYVDIEKVYRILDVASDKNYPDDPYDEKEMSFYDGMVKALRIAEQIEPDFFIDFNDINRRCTIEITKEEE